MTPTRQIVEEMIHKIIQDEVAGEVWYESRQNEERLQKLLQNAEKSLSTTFSSLIEAVKREGQKRIWKEIEKILVDEINTARTEGQPTSRLTSTFNRAKAVVNEVV